MTPEQIDLVKKYLAERKENQFSQDILKKLNEIKNPGQQGLFIKRCINPAVLNKIIYKKEQK
jgi:hypothetical protein